MSEIKFYIPKNETIPTDLRLYVDDVYVEYERVQNGFRFYISLEDEQQAMMKQERAESEHGVSWRTVSIEVVPQDERYKISTIVEWKYRVRDSF